MPVRVCNKECKGQRDLGIVQYIYSRGHGRGGGKDITVLRTSSLDLLNVTPYHTRVEEEVRRV
jgi:hypothetical protein